MQTNQCRDTDSLGLVVVQERNRDLKAVEQDMMLLSEITSDMKNLTQSQSGSLDVIEKDIDSSASHLRRTVENLEEAEKYAESYRMRKIYLGFGIAAVGFVASYKALQYMFSSEKKIKEDDNK